MSDEQIIHDHDHDHDHDANQSSGKVDGISETITIPFSANIPPSKHAKILRQVANILHALLANSMRYAAISDGTNAGAGFQIHQQTYSAAANADAAATTLEQSQRAVLTGGMQIPPPPRPGRA